MDAGERGGAHWLPWVCCLGFGLASAGGVAWLHRLRALPAPAPVGAPAAEPPDATHAQRPADQVAPRADRAHAPTPARRSATDPATTAPAAPTPTRRSVTRAHPATAAARRRAAGPSDDPTGAVRLPTPPRPTHPPTTREPTTGKAPRCPLAPPRPGHRRLRPARPPPAR